MFVNIAGYKFISIAFLELNAIRDQLREYALQLEIKGTILLSTEGVNIFVAGSYLAMDDFKKSIIVYVDEK